MWRRRSPLAVGYVLLELQRSHDWVLRVSKSQFGIRLPLPPPSLSLIVVLFIDGSAWNPPLRVPYAKALPSLPDVVAHNDGALLAAPFHIEEAPNRRVPGLTSAEVSEKVIFAAGLLAIALARVVETDTIYRLEKCAEFEFAKRLAQELPESLQNDEERRDRRLC